MRSCLYILFLLIFMPFSSVMGQTAIDLSKPVGTTSGSGGVSGSGGSAYQIPIQVPSVTGGVQPNISLSYSSQSGDGVAGWGWNLSCLSMITRAGKTNYYNGINTPVAYTADDAFMLDGKRMFLLSGVNGSVSAFYGLENEEFTEIKTVGNTGDGLTFELTTRSGTVYVYGDIMGATVMNTDNTTTPMFWLLSSIRDRNGNYEQFSYNIDETNRTYQLSEIEYGSNIYQFNAAAYKVLFSYGTKENSASLTQYDGGASVKNAFNLSAITVTNSAGTTVSSYAFAYNELHGQYFLTSVVQKGSDGVALNPLTFTYGSNTTAADVATSIQVSEMQQIDQYAGDFDGDSKHDILTVNYTIDNNGVRHDGGYYVYSYFNSSYSAIAQQLYVYAPPSGTTATTQVQNTNNAYTNYLIDDYDGDGKEDVMLVHTIAGNYYDLLLTGVTCNYSRTYSGASGMTYEGADYKTTPTSGILSYAYLYHSGTTYGRYFIPGDFDGDGAQDYILILGSSPSIGGSYSTSSFKAFFCSPKKNIFNVVISSFGVGSTDAMTVAQATQLIPFDFDGDGKQEILVVNATQSYVLSITATPGTSGNTYAASVLYSMTNIKNHYPIYPGDFNGDGKIDLLYRSNQIDATAQWYILMSTGKAFVSSTFNWMNRVYLPQDGQTSSHNIVVADLNGDGRTDLWESLDLTTSTSKHNIAYSNGTSFTWETYPASVSTNAGTAANGETTIGDFNGDGKADMVSVDNLYMGRFIYPKPFKEDRLMVQATNGVGVQQNFTYSLTNDGICYSRSAAYQYDQSGITIGTGLNGNPYNVLNTPLYVVSQSSGSNGIGGVNYTDYQYTDAAFSRIRGFLGFATIKTTDESTGITTGVQNSFDATLLVPHTTYRYTAQNGQTLNSVTITDNFVKLNTNTQDKRYVYQVLNTLSSDMITGAGSSSSNTYDLYGNITQNVIQVGSIANGVVSAVETTTTSTSYGTHNTPYPCLADAVTISRTRSGQPAFAKTTGYTYDANDNVATKIDFSGLPNAVTTTFTRDSYGNVTSQVVSAAGMTSRVQNNTYDATGRFLTQKQTVGSGVTKKEVYTYEPLFGHLASEKTSDGLTTSYTYDALGRAASTTVPDGYVISTAYSWESSVGRYSVSVTRPGGGSNVKTYYDVLGREIQKEVTGFNSNLLTSVKTYNAKGQLASDVNPHYSSETAVTNVYQYDAENRIISKNNGTIGVTYSYQTSNGNYFTTATNSAGQAKVQATDGAGTVVSTTDNGGVINYTYNSQGKPIQVSLNGATTITNTYDSYGNQISIVDRNSGTTSYTFDAFGQMASQTDALGHTTNNTYDVLGRLITRAGMEGTTNYTYWSDAATGYANDKVVQITGFAGDVKSYTYDSYRRVSSQTVTVDGTSYVTGFLYDSYGNPIQETYPTGVIITRSFDRNGILTQVAKGTAGNAAILFSATAMNSFGRYTAYSYGNGKSSTEAYNPATGTPTQFLTSGVQNLNFTFNLQTGNLTERKDLIKNMDETFTYDNLNRLLTTTLNNVQQLNIAYDGQVAGTLGNITSKTDAGDYVYRTDKVNAVAYITSPQIVQTVTPAIPQSSQEITYTPFMKTQTVTDNGYVMTYTYGGNYERIKSVLTLSGTTVETKYYMDGYERQVKNGTTNDVIYVAGGNGLCAILVGSSVYYTYHDFLGSILTVTDASGNIVAEQNFDAWGRKRNPGDWTYNGIPVNPDWLYRGFTGHEHLNELALINMNGRMYDPVQGRMMSADPFVTDQDYTQSYNRYSYGYNNPLTFIDPSGNNVFSWMGSAIKTVVHAGESFFKDAIPVVLLNPFGYIGASLESGSWSVSHWNSSWWKGTVTADLLVLAAALDFATFGVATPVAGSAAAAALSVISGASNGVLLGAATTFVADDFKFNWSDQFIATTTGAITGTFGSEGMAKWLKDIPGFNAEGMFKGVESGLTGSILSSALGEFESGGSWNSAFQFNTILTTAATTSIGSIIHTEGDTYLKLKDELALKRSLTNVFSTAIAASIGNLIQKQPFLSGYGDIQSSLGSISGAFGGWYSDMNFAHLPDVNK